LPVAQRFFQNFENRFAAGFHDAAECLPDGRGDQFGIRDGGELDKKHAVFEIVENLARDCLRERCFAGSADAGQRQNSDVLAPQQIADFGDFLFAPDEWDGMREEVVRRQFSLFCGTGNVYFR
jgi:hypothetical protein